jgi:hypothetical protein
MKKPYITVTITADEEGINESLTIILNTKKCGEIFVWRDVTAISDVELVDLKKSIKFAEAIAKELKISIAVDDVISDHIADLENPSALAGTNAITP